MSDVENCTLSDDEDCHGCPLCAHTDEPFVDRMDDMEEEMTTTASENQVYKSQVETYNNEVVNPLHCWSLKKTAVTGGTTIATSILELMMILSPFIN